MIYALIGCLLIIGFLGYKLFQKQKIDRYELEEYKTQLRQTQQQIQQKYKEFDAISRDLIEASSELVRAKEDTAYEKSKLEECRKDLQAALDTYTDITDNKLKEIETTMTEQRQKRQEELDKHLQETKEKYQLILDAVERDCQNKAEKLQQELDDKYTDVSTRMNLMEKATQAAENMYQSLLEPLKMYEKERQEKLFYTIQLPEEYRDDIEFLLTTVAAKVQHPDIISKLVWSEYVKPNLDDTFKRIEIKAEPGIYKITNLDSGKAYIGKSTDVKKRLTDHFKSSVGISTIAHQNVHDAIRKYGFWNWSIEVITYCEKEQLSELEKHYIDFFQTNSFGYNRTNGGEG